MKRFLPVLGAALIGACAPTVILPGPALHTPDLTDERFTAADGTKMTVRAWRPNGGETKAVIIALHGFNDYSNFFAAPGGYLAGRGITSYAYDQRGFGQTPHRGLWPGTRAYVDDLRTFAGLVRTRHPGVQLFLLGASMGGAVAMVAMTSADRPLVDGVILAGPAVWGRATMPWYQTAALWLGAHTVGWLKLTGKGLNIKPSDNRRMLEDLGRDPLIIKETRIDAMYGVANLMDAALAVSGDFAAKALILYGDHDEIVPPEPVFMMLRALPPSARERQKVALYEAGYHMLLRDLQGETVWRDIAAWIEDPTQPLPSGAGKRAEEKLAGN